MTRYDNRHKNIRPQPPSKENHMMPKILKGDVISWSKDGYSWRRVDHAGGDTPVNTQPTEGWITRMPARPGVYTPPWKPQYYNECKTLRQTSSLQPPKQRATFRPLTFPNKLRIMYLLFFLKFAKVNLIKLEELTLVLPPLACPVVVVVTTACLLLDINYEHLVIAIYVDGALCFCSLHRSWEVVSPRELFFKTGANP